MALFVREFASHQKEVQAFVFETVAVILERLNEQAGREVRCHYSNDGLRDSLYRLLDPLTDRYPIDAAAIAAEFVDERLDDIVEACRRDAERYPTQDPALENLEEVFYSSNGFWATVAYRLANALLRLDVPIIPRSIAGIAHSRTGIDIHPGATIAPGLFIDHGTGIAIGCTAVLHENVNLYNGVVLGTRGKPKRRTDDASGGIQKRHPTIHRDVSTPTRSWAAMSKLARER